MAGKAERSATMQPPVCRRAVPRAAVYLLLLFTVCSCSGRGQGQKKCPQPQVPCECPARPPTCEPGVRRVLDGCSCCLVCARQRGDACSELLPCDESRGLYCDRGAAWKADGSFGVCRDLEGDNCVFDGVIHQNGETFEPSCKYHCTCRDGQISCVPRCNLDLLLPGPECPFPRKIEVPTECCERWTCEPNEEEDLGSLAMPAFTEDSIFGLDASDGSSNCIAQTTEWSACSTSCGMGVSTRVTNDNPMCEIVKVTRLCEVRPCGNSQLLDKKGKRCLRIKKSPTAVRFEYRNCTSVQLYKPRYCGICNDGRCCTPHNTKTIQVEFRCPDGTSIRHPVMSIATCSCHGNCPQDDNTFFRKLN